MTEKEHFRLLESYLSLLSSTKPGEAPQMHGYGAYLTDARQTILEGNPISPSRLPSSLAKCTFLLKFPSDHRLNEPHS